MTLFAVACAGHVPAAAPGPAVVVLLAAAVPEHDGPVAAVPQPAGVGRVRGQHVCDVSLLFWYVGLIPDLATLRDRAQHRSAQDRLRHSRDGLARIGARTGTAIRRRTCCWPGWRRRWWSRVHSVVGMDFAGGIVPGWHSTIFPPYFVAGAIFSGFAMVLTLAIPLRNFSGSKTSSPCGTSTTAQADARHRPDRRLRLHACEMFMAWYSGNEYEQYMMHQPHVRPVLAWRSGC